jgi:hypothetical protein
MSMGYRGSCAAWFLGDGHVEAGAAVRMHHAYPAFLYTIPDTPPLLGNRALVPRH